MAVFRSHDVGARLWNHDPVTVYDPLDQSAQDDPAPPTAVQPLGQMPFGGLGPTDEQSAADPTGQLWFGQYRFLTSNPAGDNRVAHIDSDGNGLAGFANPSGSSDHFYVSVGLDTAAGLYFAVSEIVNGDASTALEVRGTGTNALTQSLLLNPHDYTVGALAVDTARHYIYIGVWGDSAADTGILKLGYDPTTGHIQDPSTHTDISTIFNGSVIDSKYYVVSEAGSYAATNPMQFSFDQANNKLYLAASDQDFSHSGTPQAYPGYPATNGVYVVDLNQATPTTTLLTTDSSQFPTDFSGDRIVSVAYDAKHSLVYFESTNANGGGDVHLWYVSASGGTAHEISLSGIVDATHGVLTGDLALDPNSQTLYLGSTDASENSNIYKLVMNAGGTAVASHSIIFTANASEAGTWGMDFSSLPSLSLTATTQEVVQQGSAQALLSGVTITDSDSGYLAGATIVITDAQTGDSLAADVTGTNIAAAAYDSSTHTLTLSGYDTIANYEQVLESVALTIAGTDPSTGSHPTRTIDWTVSDGTTLTSPTGSDPNQGSTIVVVDRSPTGFDSTNAVFEGSNISVGAAAGVLFGASDLDGDSPIRVSELSGGDVGVLSATAFGHITLNADGSYTYVADQTSAIDFFPNDAVLVDHIDFTIGDGLGGTVDHELDITVDQAPAVESVAADAVSGADLSQAHTITLTYTLGKNVDSAAGTTLQLSDGATATYASGSGSKVLTFTTSTTDASLLGVSVSSVTGSFADAAGNAVPLADTAITDYSLTVSDTAAHVAAFLDSLESHAGNIAAIHLTDGGGPTLNLTQDQVTNDADALHLIDNGSYLLHVTGANAAAPDTGASFAPPNYSSYDVFYNSGILSLATYHNDDGTTTYVAGVPGVSIDESFSTKNDYYDLSHSVLAEVAGGSGNDGFYFGAKFNSNDTVDGGGGTQNQIGLQGDYSGGVVLDGSNIQNIQGIAFLAGFNYVVTTNNLLSPGQTMLVQASHLASGNFLDFDGSTETNGQFKVMGGAGADTIATGAGDDVLYGLGGADTLTGGAGADHFAYVAVSDSTSTAHDTITDFDASVDKFDLPVSVTGINATVVGGTLDSGADFDNQLTTATASLGAHHAILFEPDTGGLANHIILVVDANGTPGYQAGQDFVFDVTGATNLASLAATSFI